MVVVERDVGEDGSSKKRSREDLRAEMARLETPHITDVKTALLDSFALGLHTKGLTSLDRLTYLREACELGMFQLYIHSLSCTCQVPGELMLTDDLFESMAASLSAIQVPHIAYRDERDRAAGMKRAYWSIPELGKSYESSAEPERQPLLAERTEEAVAHSILNSSMIRASMMILGLLQVHQVVPYEEAEPTLDLGIQAAPTPAVVPARTVRPIREMPPDTRAALAKAIGPVRRELPPKPPEQKTAVAHPETDDEDQDEDDEEGAE